MIKVITYGTFDLLHHGHIRLLRRAKELGDELYVGITSDAYDRFRGKINVQQSLSERIDAVRKTGLADHIIVEEYEGQKIDDIRKYGIDIFTVGSDWVGKFDYLKQYCEVIYLERTEGVSSSGIRAQEQEVRIGLVGESGVVKKYEKECAYVNGATVIGYAEDDYDALLDLVDAVFIISHPSEHYEQVKKALEQGKHVLCESPIALCEEQSKELFNLADEKNRVLFDSIKTAYSTAYERMVLLAKGGHIGDIVSVDATCTSLEEIENYPEGSDYTPQNSICSWGPAAMLPVFQILGTDYLDCRMTTMLETGSDDFDAFTKMDFIYRSAVASVLVGKRIKSEGELIVTGTKGYLYVPAPWWKTDYFELRYERASNNRRFFYQLDGEGIRNEISFFIRAIHAGSVASGVEREVSMEIVKTIQHFYDRKDVVLLGRKTD